MDYVSAVLRRFQQLLWPTLTHPLATLETFFPAYYPFSGTRFSPATGIGDLEGKVILVTGGNSGLGRETVLQLARHGPRKIFLASRDERKANDAIASIRKELVEEVDIEYVSINLTSLSSVKTAAERVKYGTDSLDILVLNAGVMAMPMCTTEGGYEIHMGTNHIGHHLLTRLLLPLLEKTAAEQDSDVRVVTVSSEGHRIAPPIATITSTAALSESSPLVRYAASKAANVLFAAELARRHPSLTSVSLHPGVIMTDLYNQGRNDGDLVLQGLKALSIITTQSVEDGALTQLWCAAGARKDELTSGGYYTVETLREWNGWARDEVAGKKLWDWTEGELARSGF